MKRLATAAVALCFVAGAATAQTTQQKAHTETTVKQTGPGPDSKMKGETVVGTVKEYEAGKKIKISGPGDKTYTFDLDEGAKVDGTIVVGQMAKVTYHKMDNGTEHVSVISKASAQDQMAASAPKVHSESTVKHEGPGPDTKMKSEVVIGTVKEYEPGKKIKVVGPKDKDFSFDLDENVGMKGPVAVGDRVKVTYTKTNSGQKVTTVEPYKGM
jgi:hypothetical protein